MSDTERAGWPKSRALHWPVLLPYLLVVALLGLLGAASVDILSATRGFVGGESLWSKGQKDASARLADYVRTGDERHHKAVLAALAVPLGDQRARLALQRQPPDLAAAREGFLAGGNHPDDIDSMIRLFRNFGGLPFFADAIALWTRGDGYVSQLKALADEVHAAGPAMPPARRDAYARRAAALDAEVSELSRRFSEQLGFASRTTRNILAGSTLVVTVALALMGALFVQRALGRLAASERSLREGNQRWELAASANGIGVFEWLPARGEILLDARALALHGLTETAPARLPQRRLREVIHPDDRERVDAMAAAQVAAEPGPEQVEQKYRVRMADGTERHIELFARRASEGGPIVGVMRDVSDMALAEQLRLEKLAAERASAAKTEFLSRASHELRTPLNAVLGFAQMMRLDRDEPLGNEQLRRVRMIERGGESLVRLVNNLLDLASLDQGEFVPEWEDLHVAGLVARAGARVEPLRAARQASIALLPGADPVRVRTDARAAEQIFANLIANAIQHGPSGGAVTVEVTGEPEFVVVDVRDRGPGMSADQVRQLFQPFARVGAEYRAVDGAGLGLVVCRRLAERVDGTIELISEPGQGTTARVRFPRSRP